MWICICTIIFYIYIYIWNLELFCSNPGWFAQVFPQCALSQLVRPPDVDDVTGEALLWGVLDHLHGATRCGEVQAFTCKGHPRNSWLSPHSR